MFEWLFGKKKTKFVRPTERQKRYAYSLKIAVRPDMSRDQLSALIAKAESDPRVQQDRKRKRVETYGQQIVAAEEQWDDLADQNKWIAVAYASGKSTKAVVGMIGGGSIEGPGKLIISVETARIDSDGLIDVEGDVQFDVTKILWSKVFDDLEVDDVDQFTLLLKQAEAAAKNRPR